MAVGYHGHIRATKDVDIVPASDPMHERKWEQVWECDELLDLVDEFERSLV